MATHIANIKLTPVILNVNILETMRIIKIVASVIPTLIAYGTRSEEYSLLNRSKISSFGGMLTPSGNDKSDITLS